MANFSVSSSSPAKQQSRCFCDRVSVSAKLYYHTKAFWLRGKLKIKKKSQSPRLFCFKVMIRSFDISFVVVVKAARRKYSWLSRLSKSCCHFPCFPQNIRQISAYCKSSFISMGSCQMQPSAHWSFQTLGCRSKVWNLIGETTVLLWFK